MCNRGSTGEIVVCLLLLLLLLLHSCPHNSSRRRRKSKWEPRVKLLLRQYGADTGLRYNRLDIGVDLHTIRNVSRDVGKCRGCRSDRLRGGREMIGSNSGRRCAFRRGDRGRGRRRATCSRGSWSRYRFHGGSCRWLRWRLCIGHGSGHLFLHLKFRLVFHCEVMRMAKFIDNVLWSAKSMEVDEIADT